MVDNFNENIIWKIYDKDKFFAKYFTAFLIVSMTRMRRDTEMLLLSVGHLGNKFNIVSNDHAWTHAKVQFFGIPVLSKFGLKNQNFQFNLIFGIKPKLNMHDLIYVNFFCFGLEIPFLEKFGLKI